MCDVGSTNEDCDGEVNEEGANYICSDGYLSTGEECDDGNANNNDACTALCKE